MSFLQLPGIRRVTGCVCINIIIKTLSGYNARYMQYFLERHSFFIDPLIGMFVFISSHFFLITKTKLFGGPSNCVHAYMYFYD